MWSNVVAKETFKRSLVIFAASVGGAVIAALLLCISFSALRLRGYGVGQSAGPYKELVEA